MALGGRQTCVIMGGSMESPPLKPFAEMTPADYAAIGLKCGLEVHQQLLTRSKLFCRCPAGHYSCEYDAEVLRHMRPTLSEMGEYDGTALMEKKTRKNITYRLHHDTVCTYEFDDTPPFPIDDNAIDIALEIALLLRLNIVNELHIARKQYLDGSIPTGFQRTTILGVDGSIPFRDRTIGIRQLGLEEDSCREVSDLGHERTYLTDRLGMPLIEVVTEPEMFTPHETAEVCDLIRKICRSTQKVRRGYGATRQDVNVSVEGGTRIEIKGVPQIWRIPHLIYNEASRQVALLRIRDTLHSRGVSAETLETTVEDVTGAVAPTRYEPLRSAVDEGNRVLAVNLKQFGGLLNAMTQETTRFAKEFSDRVRVIACLTELPNTVHSDAASDSLSARDWQALRKRVKSTPQDAMILVWGDERDTRTACDEIIIRAREATIGVPSDTRQPFKDGTNGFERVLPGADRMYPDTDLPPIELTTIRLGAARDRLPEDVWVTEARFRENGMVADDADRLCISARVPLLNRAINELAISGALLGVLLAQRVRHFRRQGLKPERLCDDAMYALLSLHAEGAMAREGLAWMMEGLLRTIGNDTIDAEDVGATIDELNIRPATDDEIDQVLRRARAEGNERTFATDVKRERFLMGRLMRELIGRVDGARLKQLVAGVTDDTVQRLPTTGTEGGRP